MKRVLIISLALILITYCKKDDGVESSTCNNLTTVDGWQTIDFKTAYSIQIPDGFTGPGMTGFEGNTFSKMSPDSTMILSYGYCTALFCHDFGDTLQASIPTGIKIKNISGDEVTLNKFLRFCDNSGTVGILYYLENSSQGATLYWNGRLYWKDNDLFKQAMQVSFQSSDLETIKKIIETIKAKQLPQN